MNKIYLLTDYNNTFGSKAGAVPYRSGMDKGVLKKLFYKSGYEVDFVCFSEVQNLEFIENIPVLYTSSEDPGYEYKSYIEDVVLFLKNRGAHVIPRYEFLRANNNKSFMELIRKTVNSKKINTLDSWSFGSLEEVEQYVDEFDYPIVLKEATGAMGRGVYLAKNKHELLTKIRKVSRTKYLHFEIKDRLRPIKHKDYKRQSLYRKKFILQEFVPNLENDWKVYVFGDKIFVFKRPVIKSRGFRASGGGYDNYSYGLNADLPEGLLEYSYNIFKEFDVPNASLDIIKDENGFHLIEYQMVYFGTSGILQKYSKHYFSLTQDAWKPIENNYSVEEVYVDSVINFLTT